MAIAIGDNFIKQKAGAVRILSLINNLPLIIESFLSFSALENEIPGEGNQNVRRCFSCCHFHPCIYGAGLRRVEQVCLGVK